MNTTAAVLTTRHRMLDSPIGPLTLVGSGSSLTALYFPGHTHGPAAGTLGDPDEGAFPAAVAQLGEYFAGARTEFELELAPTGNPFQQRVWALLRQIPYGRTRTYGQLAAELGDLRLARAVGAANGRNPLSIVVPCHRVVGASGKLVGYAGGLERKAYLLNLESRQPLPGGLF